MRMRAPAPEQESGLSDYTLEITTGDLPPNIPAVALDARVPSVYAAHSFHACSSAEGVHLTAWDGAKPLEGHRLWHAYYYLGHNFASDCTQAEISE